MGQLHNKAKTELESVWDEMKQISNNVNKSADSIDLLVTIMKEIKSIRKRELEMEYNIKPILEMYKLLAEFSEDEEIPSAEQEIKNNIENEWKNLLKTASDKFDEMRDLQKSKKSDLLS